MIPLMANGQSMSDENDINKIIDELLNSWNTHDFSSMKRNSTKDMNWINITGMWWKGREIAVSSHNAIFNSMFNGVKFEKKSLVLRPITNDVIIANLIIHVGDFYPPDGIDHGNNKRNATDDILTLVFVKKDAKWLLTAAQNTVVDAFAAKMDPQANRK